MKDSDKAWQIKTRITRWLFANRKRFNYPLGSMELDTAIKLILHDSDSDFWAKDIIREIKELCEKQKGSMPAFLAIPLILNNT